MKTLKLYLFTLLLCAVCACSKDKKQDIKTPEPPPVEEERPPLPDPVAIAKGFGPSKEAPEGDIFKLPAGIEMVIRSVDKLDDNDCACKENIACQRGYEGLVSLCLTFKNNTNKPIKITFPAGLLFVSIATDTQNGLLLQLETFEIPANEVGQYKLDLFCANEGRHQSFKDDEYELGPVTEVPEVRALIDMLKNKDMSGTGDAAAPQAALWAITNSWGLDDELRQDLLEIPDKTK